MLVIFKDWRCVTKWGMYANGRLALQLLDEDSGEPIAKASVNISGGNPPSLTQIDMKCWEENEGMAEALVKAGVGHIVDVIDLGRVTAMRFELSPVALAEAREQGWKG